MSEGPHKYTVSYIWPAIGFALGTVLMTPLILSGDILQQVLAGMAFGGIPLGLIGLLCAMHRAGRSK